MPRVNRREIVADGEIQAFHAINRCVRRSPLCGKDKRSGKDYSHRKDWVRQRLETLAGIFGVDILGFAVMSNHLHVVVRTRPDVVRGWTDEEIARRWWNLFPKRKQKDQSAAEPTEADLAPLLNHGGRLQEIRRRLSNLSWFMKCLCEPISKRANREDDVTGHFWESRYKAQPLLDELAIAACLAYVDLNPVRAGVAVTPEASDYTSVQERIRDRHSARESARKSGLQTVEAEHGDHAGWLAPVQLEPRERRQKTAREERPVRRASHKGFLFMSLDDYLRLLDWTGRQLKRDKPGVIARGLPPILDRLECTEDTWLDLVRHFRRRFRTEAGRAETLASAGNRRRDGKAGNLRS